MIVLRSKLHIEFNNCSYAINLAPSQNNQPLEMGMVSTLFIRSINNHKVSPEFFFNELKNLISNSIFSLYLDGRRYVAKHITAHLHLNVGTPYATRKKAIFFIEWQINVIVEI